MSMRLLRLGDQAIYPAMQVRVGGQDALFLIDTGSPGIGVSRRMAGTLRAEGRRTIRLRGQTGNVKTEAIPLPDIEIGEIVLRGQEGAVIELLDRIDREMGTRIDGVLGDPLFLLGSVVVDYVAGSVTIHPGSEDNEIGTEYVPIDLRDGEPWIVADIDGAGRDGFILDTGMGWDMSAGPRSWLSRYVANRHDLPLFTDEHSVSRFGTARFADIDGIRFENVSVKLIEVSTQPENRIGSGFFADCRLVIDYPRRRVGFKRIRPASPTGWGLDVLCGSGGLRVARIFPGGPAERAGVRSGDRVLRIGGLDAPGSVPEFYDRLHAQESVALDLLRGSERVQCEMTRAGYLPVIELQPISR